MKNNTKSSITLPADELELVLSLMKKLKAKSKVEVIRRGLTLLKESTDRTTLREAFKNASRDTREEASAVVGDRDHLNDEGLD